MFQRRRQCTQIWWRLKLWRDIGIPCDFQKLSMKGTSGLIFICAVLSFSSGVLPFCFVNSDNDSLKVGVVNSFSSIFCVVVRNHAQMSYPQRRNDSKNDPFCDSCCEEWFWTKAVDLGFPQYVWNPQFFRCI